MKKILFSDLDGTLIHHTDELNPKNFIALKELRENGYIVVICTGRNIIDIQPTLKQFPIEYDYLVLCNGGHIVDNRGNTIFERVISKEVGNAIMEKYSHDNEIVTYYCNGARNFFNKDGKISELTVDGMFDIDLDFFDELKNSDKYHIIGLNQVNEKIDILESIVAEIMDEYKDEVECFFNQHYVDIVPSGCSKGNGVKELLNYLQEDLETYCIGDSYNDLSMIQIADHGYTFNRVEKKIKEHAKCVDYVYELIEEMLK